MGYLKIVSYLYLAAAAFFIYTGIEAHQNGENGYIMFAFAAIAVFMFFFRMRYAKKFDNRNKDK